MYCNVKLFVIFLDRPKPYYWNIYIHCNLAMYRVSFKSFESNAYFILFFFQFRGDSIQVLASQLRKLIIYRFIPFQSSLRYFQVTCFWSKLDILRSALPTFLYTECLLHDTLFSVCDWGNNRLICSRAWYRNKLRRQILCIWDGIWAHDFI